MSHVEHKVEQWRTSGDDILRRRRRIHVLVGNGWTNIKVVWEFTVGYR